MAQIKVRGYKWAPALMVVFACLYEKNLDFEHNFEILRDGAIYLFRHLYEDVELEDGNLKFFKLRPITQYIVNAYEEKGNQMKVKYPTIMAFLSWKAQDFYSAAEGLISELFRPRAGMTADYPLARFYKRKLEKVLDLYESILFKTKYLAGDQFSIIDLQHLPPIWYLMQTEEYTLITGRPCVSAWYSDISARPAWKKVLSM